MGWRSRMEWVGGRRMRVEGCGLLKWPEYMMCDTM